MEDLYHLAAKALIKNKEGKILLLQVNDTKLTHNSGGAYWDIPGGRVQRGSSIIQTLERELFEETGIRKIQDFRHITTIVSNIRIPIGSVDVGLILAVYDCIVDDLETIRLSDEHISFDWIAPKEASEMLRVKYPMEFIEKIELNKL